MKSVVGIISMTEFSKWQIALLELWQEAKEAFEQVENFEYEYPIQTKWSLVRDTRKNSQVMNNKPKHLIKKIIR